MVKSARAGRVFLTHMLGLVQITKIFLFFHYLFHAYYVPVPGSSETNATKSRIRCISQNGSISYFFKIFHSQKNRYSTTRMHVKNNQIVTLLLAGALRARFLVWLVGCESERFAFTAVKLAKNNPARLEQIGTNFSRESTLREKKVRKIKSLALGALPSVSP